MDHLIGYDGECFYSLNHLLPRKSDVDAVFSALELPNKQLYPIPYVDSAGEKTFIVGAPCPLDAVIIDDIASEIKAFVEELRPILVVMGRAVKSSTISQLLTLFQAGGCEKPETVCFKSHSAFVFKTFSGSQAALFAFMKSSLANELDIKYSCCLDNQKCAAPHFPEVVVIQRRSLSSQSQRLRLAKDASPATFGARSVQLLCETPAELRSQLKKFAGESPLGAMKDFMKAQNAVYSGAIEKEINYAVKDLMDTLKFDSAQSKKLWADYHTDEIRKIISSLQ